MFWRKVFHVLTISILLMRGISAPSVARESKLLDKSSFFKPKATTYTVCASGCDFISIQTAINSVSPGDTLSLAGETFTKTLSDVTFSNNSAMGETYVQGEGGGLMSGGGLYAGVYGPALITLTNVSFIGNMVTHPNGVGNGGGMHTDRDSNPTLNNVIFSGNSVNGSGGGIFNFEDTAFCQRHQ